MGIGLWLVCGGFSFRFGWDFVLRAFLNELRHVRHAGGHDGVADHHRQVASKRNPCGRMRSHPSARKMGSTPLLSGKSPKGLYRYICGFQGVYIFPPLDRKEKGKPVNDSLPEMGRNQTKLFHREYGLPILVFSP